MVLHPGVDVLHPKLQTSGPGTTHAMESRSIRGLVLKGTRMSKAMKAQGGTRKRTGRLRRAGAVFPLRVAAQAPPGPIRPAGDSGDLGTAPSRPAAQPETVVPDKKQLFASWKLNLDQSDDAQDKMREARHTGADNPAGSPGGGGGNGTGIHLGGVGSPFPGGGGGGNGGGNPRTGGSRNGT